MSNENGNGNNNGYHRNGNASLNGNGHHPAPNGVNGNGAHQDSGHIPGHDLLWDGLSPAVVSALGQPLDPELVSQRRGRGNRNFDYIEGHTVIDQANRIFGFGGWGYELAGDVSLRRIESVDTRTGEIKVSIAYSAPVRVTVNGAPSRTDLGFHVVTDDNPEGHETAAKGAVTDGLKRAFRSFGDRFGNGLYGDQPPASTRPRAQAKGSTATDKGDSDGKNGQGTGNRRDGSYLQQLRVAAGGAGVPAGVRRGTGAGRRQEADRQGAGGPARQGPEAPGGRRRPQGAGETGRRWRRRQQLSPMATTSFRGRLQSVGGPASHLPDKEDTEMTATKMHTPWGYPQDIEELAEGVWRIETAGHGGLKLSRERWEELPDLVRDTFITPTFAEEDCEEPIARTLLGISDEREREFALKVAGYFDRYAPALPYLRDKGGA